MFLCCGVLVFLCLGGGMGVVVDGGGYILEYLFIFFEVVYWFF